MDDLVTILGVYLGETETDSDVIEVGRMVGQALGEAANDVEANATWAKVFSALKDGFEETFKGNTRPLPY